MQQGWDFPGVSLGSCEVGTAGNGREPLPNLPSFPPALLLCVLSQELLLGWDQPWEDPRKSLEVSIPKVWDPSLGSIPRIWHPFQHSGPYSLRLEIIPRVWDLSLGFGVHSQDLGSSPRAWSPFLVLGSILWIWSSSFGSSGSGVHSRGLGIFSRVWSSSPGSRIHS